MLPALLLGSLLVAAVDPLPPAATVAPSSARAAAYLSKQAKSVLDLQQFRTTQTIRAEGESGQAGQATLVNLNPDSNSWFLLVLEWGTPSTRLVLHLENPRPHTQQLTLDAEQPRGVLLTENGERRSCELWGPGAGTELKLAQQGKRPFNPLCGDRLYLRTQVIGSTTSLEWVTDLLRDHAPEGDRLVGFVRRKLYHDAFLSEAPLTTSLNAAQVFATGPQSPALTPRDEHRAVVPGDLGLALDMPPGPTVLGRWYPAQGSPGVFVSVVEPGAVSLDAPSSAGGPLDTIESRALVYLVAFDLGSLDLGFSIGTDHPRVGWSERTLAEVRSPDLPGPDGIASLAPLVGTGMVSPVLLPRIAAAFTGGFKRIHGAFHSGALAHQNRGTHYGFIEQGVVLSKLEPGLSTLYVLDDGTVGLKTWSLADDAGLWQIRFARQNGVPLIERNAASGAMQPGSLVSNWSAGNWSGSEGEGLRTLRAGACLQDSPGHRFLIYGYFSSATPSAMARVFLAYRCSAAMHLDMNALEHTYLALYQHEGSALIVEHLSTGMAVVDKKGPRSKRDVEGAPLPRFLGFADDRDFFYLVWREPTP